MIKYQRYTPAEVAQIIELYKTHSRPQIAAITGRTDSAIKSKLNDQAALHIKAAETFNGISASNLFGTEQKKLNSNS